MWRVEADIHFSRLRRFSGRCDPLYEFSEADFVDRYRLPKSTIIDLSEKLESRLRRFTRRNFSLSVPLQLCIALRYYAEGDYMRVIGDLHGISEKTAGRVVHDVSAAIAELNHEYIKWPTDEEKHREKEGFYRYCGMPNTVGCIDGTQIAIIAPSGNESVFVNRKGRHSLNCQIVCSSNLKIFDISPKWPGSCHDAHILRNSRAWEHIEHLQNSWLLGDSAYPLLPTLMKPYSTTSNSGEDRFNKALCKGRTSVERCIGVLKSRFRCLAKTMTFSPAKCSAVILSCATLHNIATDLRLSYNFIDSDTDNDIHADNESSPVSTLNENSNTARGQQLRDQIVRNVFSV